MAASPPLSFSVEEARQTNYEFDAQVLAGAKGL
jgi:hypothetical protein